MENITIRETPRRKKRMNFGMYQAIKVVVFIVFALYAVSLAFPFFWMLFNSVKPNGEFLSGNIFGLPEKATFKNYVNILQYRIGGESIFRQFLPYCNTVYLTHIDYEYDADVKFPVNLWKSQEWEMVEEGEEQTYFSLCYTPEIFVRKQV